MHAIPLLLVKFKRSTRGQLHRVILTDLCDAERYHTEKREREREARQEEEMNEKEIEDNEKVERGLRECSQSHERINQSMNATMPIQPVVGEGDGRRFSD